MKAFTESQFGYCPLILVFHSRDDNKKNSDLHEQSLQIVYLDNISSFQDLFKRYKSFTFYQRSTQSLAIEFFKVKRNLSKNTTFSKLEKLTTT